MFVPGIVIRELVYGAYRSRRFDENMTRVEEFASVIAVLACDAVTARHYAQIKHRCRRPDDLYPRTTPGSPP